MRYVYPAILTPDNELDDWYVAKFPDLDGCETASGDLYSVLLSAARNLNEFLEKLEDTGAKIPEPTDIRNVEAAAGEIVTLIKANTEAHRLLSAKFAAV